MVHLFSGRPVCQLSLPHDTLHADLDGDGVLEHVTLHADDGHGAPNSCTAVATAGVPPRTPLFRTRICHRAGPQDVLALLAGEGGGDGALRVLAALQG